MIAAIAISIIVVAVIPGIVQYFRLPIVSLSRHILIDYLKNNWLKQVLTRTEVPAPVNFLDTFIQDLNKNRNVSKRGIFEKEVFLNIFLRFLNYQVSFFSLLFIILFYFIIY